MRLSFTCNKNDYPIVEMLLYAQSYENYPYFDGIDLIVDGNIIKYDMTWIGSNTWVLVNRLTI